MHAYTANSVQTPPPPPPLSQYPYFSNSPWESYNKTITGHVIFTAFRPRIRLYHCHLRPYYLPQSYFHFDRQAEIECLFCQGTRSEVFCSNDPFVWFLWQVPLHLFLYFSRCFPRFLPPLTNLAPVRYDCQPCSVLLWKNLLCRGAPRYEHPRRKNIDMHLYTCMYFDVRRSQS